MSIVIGNKTVAGIHIANKEVQRITIGGKIAYEKGPDYFRLKNISNEDGVFKMVKQGDPITPNLEYSLDGTTWTTYDFSTLPEVQVAAGANIYFRGTNANNQFNKISTTNAFSFNFNKTCEGHGNMCSLFNPDPAVFSTITSIGERGLCSLFKGCTSLVTAPDLSNVTSIGTSGLDSAFKGCTSLVTAPDLSSLTSIDSRYALRSVFEGCTSLVTAPDLSSLTSIQDGGLIEIFYGCTSLVTAPDLSNVTSIGNEGLGGAFKGCTSLVTAPDLSNVTSIGTSGIRNAFDSCLKLSTATAPNVQDLTVNNILSNWLFSAGTQATGTKTVNVPTGATITTGSTSGIPTGWTRVDY